jgi:hypothetical protein
MERDTLSIHTDEEIEKQAMEIPKLRGIVLSPVAFGG